jgi:glycosyltransferase involved in cell wall biosynthesis
MKYSIVVPCFNEEKTLEKIIYQVLKSNINIHEVIIVDDCSNDNSKKIAQQLSEDNNIIKLISHDVNLGKGAALRSGFEKASGDVIIIQDSDLEYDPSELVKLIQPFEKYQADVVYGSRFLGGDFVRLHFFWHYLANKLLTFLCNCFTNLNMTDMETGYKLIKKNKLDQINLKETSFGIEPELTIKLSKLNSVFYEVPISYNGRSYDEGKKIGLKDAFRAIYCIVKYKFFD